MGVRSIFASSLKYSTARCEALPAPDEASFDVMQQSLALTTLAGLREGCAINVERAARDGAEIGGHPLSGHIDFMARIGQIRRPENNCVLRFEVAAPWMRYVFAKGYIAVNGASLTVAEAQRQPLLGARLLTVQELP